MGGFLEKLERLVRTEGFDFFGVADLSPVREEVERQGGDIIAAYPTAISIGLSLPRDIIQLLPRRDEQAVSVAYNNHCYDVPNLRLNDIASRVGGLVQAEGWRAFPLPVTARMEGEDIRAPFSHKLAAHLAGLGWIGKSCLLVTPEVGPRVRWVSVLTDAPLEQTGQATDERCGSCNLCVEACPVNAFSGRAFSPGEPREARYEAKKCETYLYRLREKGGVCGMCIFACPVGKG